MKLRIVAVAAIVVLAYGCATTAPLPEPRPAETLHGIASWYGEEFAGRTTANGEIFDPSLLTAAHRTFPFGTILDITNPKTTQSVRVRVNDRGPYIGNRMIDLSYAAAETIGLIEPGVGDVDILVVKVGSGDREAPAPFDVTIASSPNPTEPPSVPTVVAEVPTVVVDQVTVETQRGDVLTRKQVGSDGRTLEEVPVAKGEATTASGLDSQRKAAAVHRASTLKQFVVQAGAFVVEANATSLQERLTAIGHHAFIDHEELYRVRIGPFATREQAVAARASLEANGMSAMIVAE